MLFVILVAGLAAHLEPESSIGAAGQAAWRSMHAFVQALTPIPTSLLISAVALLLWRNCERAFRRLDLTDLTPVTNAWGKAQSS